MHSWFLESFDQVNVCPAVLNVNKRPLILFINSEFAVVRKKFNKFDWGLDYLKRPGQVTEIIRRVRPTSHDKIYNSIKWSHLVSLSRPSCFSQNGVSRYACACQLNSCNQLIPPPQKNSDSITHAQPSKKIKKDVADFQNSRIHWVWQRRYDRLKCCEITVGKWRVEVY